MATRKRTSQAKESNCPLTSDQSLRAAANKQTAAIQNNFPPGLAQPALRALASAGYNRLEQLTRVTEKDLLALHGMGPKAVRVLREALAAQGKSFQPQDA